MPKATVSTESQRFSLRTLPARDGEEEGWVEIRVMSFGEYNRRKDLVSKMTLEGQGKNSRATMEMANEVLTQYEFSKCIVDHNLEDDGGNKLDFTKQTGIKRLDPRVGQEIETYIDKLNKWDEDVDEEDGTGPLTTSD